jgi:aryl carrier-like protein
VVVVLDELPRTPNGKLDRERLPDATPAGSGQGAPPRDDREATLVRLAGLVLAGAGEPPVVVGIHDDLVDLGLDSLTAMRLARAASDAGLALTPRTVLTTPTVAERAVLAGADDPSPGDQP